MQNFDAFLFTGKKPEWQVVTRRQSLAAAASASLLAYFQDPFSNRMNDSIAKKQCSKASGGGKKSGGTVHKTYAIVASTPVKNFQSCAAAARKLLPLLL